jgi:hypothetical protein
MQTAKQWFLLLTLSSSLMTSMSVFAADSASLWNTLPVNNGASGIEAYYPDQVTYPYNGASSITFTAGSTTTSYLKNLPSCPMDASDPIQKSIQPRCPDINGKWVANRPSNTTKGDVPTAKELTTYCPDVCKTSRNVVTSTYSAAGQTIQQVTSYTPAVCPNGYVQVTATNPQPAVQDTSSGGTPPSTDWVPNQATLTAYQNQGMTCYIDPVDWFQANYCSLGSQNSSVPNSCTSYLDLGMDPNNISKYINNAVGTSSGVFAATTNCMGNYVPGSSGTRGSPGVRYQQDGTGQCNTADVAGMRVPGTYNVLYTNDYQRIRCRPNGLYLSTDKEPATLICARVKSVWQKRSY